MVHRAAILLLRPELVLWVAFTTLCFGQARPFESPARLHRTLRRSLAGVLSIDEGGIEFRAPKLSHRWAFADIQTFTLVGSRSLQITDYENRHWHEPGEQSFSFTLAKAIPPELAARLATVVARPVINGDPIPKLSAFAEIPAHRRKRIGGSNGLLRFREDGVDYVAQDGQDGRSWRWSDIQTIANPDPWQFRVTAYREIVEFDLKRPLPRSLFDRLWDKLHASDLNLEPPTNGGHQ